MRIHIWPSEHWIDGATFAAIEEVATTAETDIRRHLPALERDLYLLVNQTKRVIPETGAGGFTLGPHCIRWDVDPQRGVEQVARTSLRATLSHECHHAERLQRRPQESRFTDWPTTAVFEGLASVIEDLAGQDRQHWRAYDPDVIRSWAEELFAQPIGKDWAHWKFAHPDGRRNIAYRVGAWIADQAMANSGRTAAELVWESPEDVIAMGSGPTDRPTQR